MRSAQPRASRLLGAKKRQPRQGAEGDEVAAVLGDVDVAALVDAQQIRDGLCRSDCAEGRAVGGPQDADPGGDSDSGAAPAADGSASRARTARRSAGRARGGAGRRPREGAGRARGASAARPVVASMATTSPVGVLPMKASSTREPRRAVGANGRAGARTAWRDRARRPRAGTRRARGPSSGARRRRRRPWRRGARPRRCTGRSASAIGLRPAHAARVRVDRVEVRDAVRPARDDERGVVRDRGRRAEAQPIAQAPDHGAGHHVERGERAVAAREVDEPARALHARRCRAPGRRRRAPGPAPARLAAGRVDGDEVVLALGDDDEPGEARAGGRRRPRRGRRRAAAMRVSKRDLAGAEVVDAEAAVRARGARCRPG